MKKLTNKTEGIINFIEYKNTRYRVLYVVLIIILSIAVLTALIPVLWLFMAGFKDADKVFSAPFQFWPESINLGKLVEVWQAVGFGKYFINTFVLVGGAVLCATLFNGLLAYAISILKPKGYKAIFYLILGSYLIPSMTALGPLSANINALGIKGYALYIPLCLMYGANAYYFMMFKTYFDSMPRALFEAARIDGANNMQVFFKVVVPLAKPIIGVVSIFAMTATFADFLVPYCILTQDKLATVIIKIYRLQSEMSTMQSFGIDKYLMAVGITIIPQIILFAIFQRQIMGTATQSGIKG